MSLLDTDTVIELLRKKKYEAADISIITVIEVLRGLEAAKRDRVKRLMEESFNIQGLDNETVEAYCNLYRKLKEEARSIPDADLLVAATALSRNMTLKTKDEHFQRLRKLGLKLE
jgi:predicted nucleic acid-binding protein